MSGEFSIAALRSVALGSCHTKEGGTAAVSDIVNGGGGGLLSVIESATIIVKYICGAPTSAGGRR